MHKSSSIYSATQFVSSTCCRQFTVRRSFLTSGGALLLSLPSSPREHSGLPESHPVDSQDPELAGALFD